MNFRDLINPQRAISVSSKLFLALLALLLAPNVLAIVISALPAAGVLLAFLLASYVASPSMIRAKDIAPPVFLTGLS
jgi:hypothetical protein